MGEELERLSVNYTSVKKEKEKKDWWARKVKWFGQTWNKLVIDFFFFASLFLWPFIPFPILLPSPHPTYISNQVYLCKDSFWKWFPQWHRMAYLSGLALFSPAGVCQPAQITWLHLPPGCSPGNTEFKALDFRAIWNLRGDVLWAPDFPVGEGRLWVLPGAWRAMDEYPPILAWAPTGFLKQSAKANDCA